MKSWISGETPGIDHLQQNQIDIPEPDAGTLLVKVSYGAMNFSDLLMIAEEYQVRPPRPFTPGQELSGIVEQVPAGSSFKPGDRVASKVLWGAFADYALVRADMAIPIPPSIDLATAAALPVVYVTALVALDHCAKTSPKARVLVHAAAGGIGLAAVEVAKARGATVIATASSPKKLALAKAHGADHGINYGDADWVDQVKAATDGRGADIIVDPVGGQIGEDSLRCIATDGVYLIVGFASGKMPKLAPHRLLLKRASAKGVYWNHDTDAKMLQQVTSDMTGLLADGKLNPVISHQYDFNDLPTALDDLANRRATGKNLLDINP